MRVYLAGPEVFLADAGAVATAKRAVCAAHGLAGVFPTDPVPGHPAASGEGPFALYARLEAQMRGCDALVANLTPFRGASADPGTVYELGFMRGLGRPAWGYANVAAGFEARTLALLGDARRARADGSLEDAEGLAVEAFGLFDNLMLEGGLRGAGGALFTADVPADARWRDLGAFARAVAAAARALGAPAPAQPQAASASRA